MVFRQISSPDPQTSPSAKAARLSTRSSRLLEALARIDPGRCFIALSDSKVSPFTWILILWLVLVVPAIFIRGAHYEEGTTIGLARGAFETGHWLTPFLYGVRFVERPVLMSWLLGAVGMLTGWVPLWLGRLPTVLALLAGAGLIYRFVRQYASPRAAMFSAVCFVISPMMLQKTVTAENDCVLSVVLFAAFIVWWTGNAAGSPGFMRWSVITLLLCAAGYIKGPQPLGYFFIGVGLYLAMRRRWRQFSVLLASGVLTAIVVGAWYFVVYRSAPDIDLWLGHSRLVAPKSVHTYLFDVGKFIVVLSLELLPALLLAGSLVLDLTGGRFAGRGRETVIALLMYAGGCSLVLTFWPDANGRYAMPSVLAITAAAGIGFEHLLARRAWIVHAAEVVAASLVIYAIVFSLVVMPLLPGIFQHSRQRGNLISAAMSLGGYTGILYVTPEAFDQDDLLYVRGPIRIVSLDNIRRSAPPFFAILTPEQDSLLKSDARPPVTQDLSIHIGGGGTAGRLIEVR